MYYTTQGIGFYGSSSIREPRFTYWLRGILLEGIVLAMQRKQGMLIIAPENK